MFIQDTTGYDRYGQQQATGRFLVLMQPSDNPNAPIRAIVRRVRMKQFGHFMMGTLRLAGCDITLSGAYGNDGLIRLVPPDVYQHGIDVPSELIAAWNTGGGWNSCGTEAPFMRAWAAANLRALTKPIRASRSL